MGKVTIAIRRCKGCVFWDHYNGNIENAVMRKLYSDNQGNAPGRRRHACQLVLRAATNEDGSFKTDDDGNPVKVPLLQPLLRATKADEPGDHFGIRTSPHFVCKHHTPKRPPYRKPSPILGIVEHVVNPVDIQGNDGLTHQLDGALETIVVQP